MKLGAYDYLLKPLEGSRLAALVQRAVETGRMMRSPPACRGRRQRHGVYRPCRIFATGPACRHRTRPT